MHHRWLIVTTVLAMITPLADAQEAEPYKGKSATIPGRIELEDYDQGGEGIAYHDQDDSNEQRAYRQDGVDIAKSKDPEDTGGFMVTKTLDEEWLQYTVDVTPGAYDLTLRGAGIQGRKATITLGETELATIELPGQGWQGWQTVLVPNVTVEQEGSQPLRIAFAGKYATNVNWIAFVPAGEGERGASIPAAEQNVEQAGVQGKLPPYVRRHADHEKRGREVAEVDRAKITGADLSTLDEALVQEVVHVAADANDGGDGSQARPFNTFEAGLDRAKQLIKQGTPTKLLVHAGTYRSMGHSLDGEKLGGEAMDTLLIIEGEAPGEVIFSGSDIFPSSAWEPIGGGVYAAPWPHDLGFNEGGWGRHNPEEAISHRNEMVFIDGEPQRQVLLENVQYIPTKKAGGQSKEYKDLGFRKPEDVLKEGQFGVVETDKAPQAYANRIFIKPAPGTDMSSATIEVAVRGLQKGWLHGSTLNIDKKRNLVLRNLVFQHHANGFSYAPLEMGAFRSDEINERKNILVENIVSRWNAGTGMKFSQGRDVTIRNCLAEYNGMSGISISVANGVVEDCASNFNNWRGHLGGMYAWSVAGFHGHCIDTLLLNCTAVGNLTDGIHLDGYNVNTILDGFVAIANNRGIFYEISPGPNLIVRSLVARNMQSGVMQINSDNQTTERTIIADNGEIQYKVAGYVRKDIINPAPKQLGWEPWDAHLGAAKLRQNVIVDLTAEANLLATGGAQEAQYNRFIRQSLDAQGNLWWSQDPRGFAADYKRSKMVGFEDWQRETGQSSSGTWAKPHFRDVANYDFHLEPGSPVADWDLKTVALDEAQIAEMQRFFEWAQWAGPAKHFSDLEGLD